MSRRARTSRGKRPLGEITLDTSIIALGVLVAALAVSMLIRAIFLDPGRGQGAPASHAEAGLGGGEPSPHDRPDASASRPAGARDPGNTTQAPGAAAVGDGAAGTGAAIPAGIRVQVQNGCGVSGAGIKLASVLRRAGGFDVIEIGNADAFDFERTVVVDRTGDGVAARAVARALGGSPIVRQRQAGRPYAVTVIVGYDGGRWKKVLAGGTP